MQTKTDYLIDILENGSSRVLKTVVVWDCERPGVDKTEVYEDVVQTQIIESVIDPATRTMALSPTPAPDPLTALEREIVEEVKKLVTLDDAFEGLDKEEDYFGGLADRRNQKIDELIEMARPLLAALLGPA